MPTKRKKLPHRLINEWPPLWAEKMLATGEEPPPGDTADYHRWFGWRFCNESVPGLPDAEERMPCRRNADG